uniref:CDP-diacylglycerol--inositol 3-phosphatidyltransferase n=1 Tax=Caligus rogercresseyi TaxID=217165 RepID=C1BPE6_CALRO|nr:CDP-diacylglycerol--inositol 3-phosphatidyltransferase [Caligus rogercresseyi]
MDSASAMLSTLTTTENVFLFVPNIIGYARILLLLISMLSMQHFYVLTSLCYGLSAALDMFDGLAARHWAQSSRFGALLDMLTDRCGTLALVYTLGTFYPSYAFFFSLMSLIDISMHWLHTHVSLLKGQASHKGGFKESTPSILRIYYENKAFLTFMCFINEAFYGALYVSYFNSGRFYMFYLIAILSFPFAILKSALALLQGFIAVRDVVQIDTEERAKKEF